MSCIIVEEQHLDLVSHIAYILCSKSWFQKTHELLFNFTHYIFLLSCVQNLIGLQYNQSLIMTIHPVMAMCSTCVFLFCGVTTLQPDNCSCVDIHDSF